MARAWDKALESTPLLAALLDSDDRGDGAMRRRALMGQLAMVAGLGAVGGPEEIAMAVREGLLMAASGQSTEYDWSGIVASYGRKIVNTPGPDLEVLLLGDLALASGAVRHGNRDATRAGSYLSLLQGQCQADRGAADSAQDWYSAAIALADRSGDKKLSVYMRGRRAVRTVYESGSHREVSEIANAGLSMARSPSLGAVECHVAIANSYARTGSRRALEHTNAAVDMAEALQDQLLEEEAGFDALRRSLHHRSYVYSRIGSLAETEAACGDAESAGMSMVWSTQLKLYLAYRLVAEGDAAEGIRHATAAVNDVPRHHRTRIFGQLVGELLGLVPETRRAKDDTEVLRRLVKGPQ